MRLISWQEEVFCDFPREDVLHANSSINPSPKGMDFDKFSFICSKYSDIRLSGFIPFIDILKNILEIDTSTIFPQFTVDTHTLSLEKNEFEKKRKVIEYDFFVKLPPKQDYSVLLEIKEIKKGEPIIVIPEDVKG